MSSTTHDIEPNGDLVVVLKKPNTTKVIPEVALRCKSKLGEKDPTFAPDTTDVKSPLMPSGLPNNAAIAGESDEIRFRVSSPHLKLASVVFKKMLNGPWKEGDSANSQPASEAEDQMDLEDSGSSDSPVGSTPDSSSLSQAASDTPGDWEITITGWHAHALWMVLHIIHGQYRKVPHSVSLEFFAHVAVIANYYQCNEAVSLAAKFWCAAKNMTPAHYGREAIMWLSVAWVFSWPNAFSRLATLVVQDGLALADITTDDLPIATILENLEAKRKSSIVRFINALAELEQKLTHGKLGCNEKCRSMMIGSLILEKQKYPDLILKKEIDCRRVSLSGLITAVNAFSSIEWIDPASRSRPHQCNPTKFMEPIIKSVQDDAKLLKLSDFKN
ncbi:unnamed protein product [Fusarium venenatum]|uniref:BTB domain-containing protein n=1 Tax=Fusarium venenatum TaxID=56646 RepID=A0A2L2TUH5_9HYPO|nr:uncharacterized protein FVRRES_00387 [Fusarium venenatum]KAH7006365.1 hypothetical protein EDB82DRAFT_522317 [Fusarium venenatum]CEI63875.1 unnamed protein product [Fusarium venenatum]